MKLLSFREMVCGVCMAGAGEKFEVINSYVNDGCSVLGY